MKLCGLFCLAFALNLSASVYSQSHAVSLDLREVTLEEFIEALKRQTGVSFLYNAALFEGAQRVSVQAQGAPMNEVLAETLGKVGLVADYRDEVVVITRAAKATGMPQAVKRVVSGVVKNAEGNSLPGVTVLLKGTQLGVVTDVDGKFQLTVPESEGLLTLVFSFVGMKTQEVRVVKVKPLSIVMQEDVEQMEEVVVTGMFTRKASSFTGSASTIKAEDLLKVGNQNVFESLKALEPSLMVFESLEFGSDPNKMPDMQLRGTSVVNMQEETGLDLRGNFQNNPNMPLFILDGFEASAVKIFDMDINRIASITILKDAAAKAIYGSKAANGVVVVETKRDVSKNLRVTYSGNLDIEAPDLSSYDLCNAEEKLEAEDIYGMYTPNRTDQIDGVLKLERLYMERKAKVAAGVNTDWMAKPLRNGVGHKHSLAIELGDEHIQLIANLSYNDVVGVMKGSDRETVAGSVYASYRNNRFRFRNELSVNLNNSSESPYGEFSEYSRLNPYWTPYDAYGQVAKNAGDADVNYPNPLYNATLNTSFTSKYTDITDNFEGEYNISPELRAKIRIGFNRKFTRADNFLPANHLSFATIRDIRKRGSYQINEGESQTMDYDFSLNYSRQIQEKHYVFGFLSYSLNENRYEETVFKAEGFPSDMMNSIFFARQYTEDTKPTGVEATTRTIAANAVFNYSFDDRLLVDLTYRLNASSQFGANQRWGNFWSAGLGWNVHNEKWMREKTLFSRLKLRASVGSTGSQGTGAYQSLATFNYSDQNYIDRLGATLLGMENNDLKWQKKMDYNVGMDMTVKNNFNLVFDYYQSITENLLVAFTLPPSAGFTTVQENVGKVKNAGVELSMSYTAFSRPQDRTYVTFSLRGAHNKNKVIRISDAMKAYNSKMDKQMLDGSKPVIKYYDGVSMNAIWAVPSLGIDPATGREIYQKKDGRSTFTYDVNDMIVCGDNLPKVNGSFGVNFSYKGIGVNVTCMYEMGAHMFNQTLIDRVENVDMNYNVDRRVLEGRWQNPGDMVRFRSLKSFWDPELQDYSRNVKTLSTSRFVQKKNELNLSSINLSYDFFRHAFVKQAGLERLTVAFYMNDIARFSTIQVERGLSYPFARNYNFSLSLTF